MIDLKPLDDILQQHVRNQKIIDQLKQRNSKMVKRDIGETITLNILIGCVVLLALMLLILGASAEDCPTPGQACKILILTPQEEQALVAPNAILDTAIAARKLDMGDVANYFKQKIKDAPAGEIKPVPTPPAVESPADNSKLPVDKQ